MISINKREIKVIISYTYKSEDEIYRGLAEAIAQIAIKKFGVEGVKEAAKKL
ncbi:hypothetical protein [Clostridium sp. UBA1652]|uniref:hypothetical protein n=1 Tax=Clostridium sp. UBA1652 TaxID=1946348 RepID=UPI002579BDF8|nr:hypothetical protein [Clostridium sp. UBA1652]